MIVLYLMACDAFHLFVPEDTGGDSANTEEMVLRPVVDIDWLPNVLSISIENGVGYTFAFGLAETSTECSIDTEYGCWTAEDCFTGYLSPQGTNLHNSYCHPLSEIGKTLEYSADLNAVISRQGEDSVAEGGQTAFPAPTEEESYEFKVTYYLQATKVGDPNAETECWVWGLDPDHFEEKNCKVPLPRSSNSSRRIQLNFEN